MKKSIILYKKIPDDLYEKLANYFQVIEFEGIHSDNLSQFESALQESYGLIGANSKVPKDLLLKAPKLKAVSTISVGYDHFDVAALTARKIALMHTPHVLTDTTADTIFMLMMMAARRAFELSLMVKAGMWEDHLTETYFSHDVHHKTIGIIGMGRIGMAVAKRAHLGFDMQVLYAGNRVNEEANQAYAAQYCELDDLFARSDFICCTMPLNENTKNMINADAFQKMKPTAILVNGARGAVVDEVALFHALNDRKILVAATDVFVKEPLPKESPLLQLPNLIGFPHAGSATHETRYKMAECAVDNLIAAINEQSIKNCVNPEVFGA